MADYTVEEYRAAAQRAYDAGNMEAAEELAQAGLALQGLVKAQVESAPAPTEPYVDEQGVTRYPNLQQVGSSEPDDIVKAGLAGIARGITSIPEGIEMAARLPGYATDRLGDLADYALGVDTSKARYGEDGPRGLFETASGEAVAAATEALGVDEALAYRGESTPAKYAGTIGEFVGPAGILRGGKKLMQASVAAGAGSEAAGQATEGTVLEPVARVVGALAAPATLNKTVRAFSKKADEIPSLENQKNAYQSAYKEADEANVSFDSGSVDSMIQRAKARVDEFDYDPDVDLQTKAAIKALENKAGQELTLGQIEKMRRGLNDRYSRGREPGVLAMRDELDELILGNESADSLMRTARGLFSRFKKTELMDIEMRKVEDALGVSGDPVTKYKQAMSSIINSPSKSKFLSQDEIEMMRNFVRGNVPEKAMRLIGKLAPSGAGLSTIINVLALSANPALVVGSAAALASKAGSQRSTRKSIEKIKQFIATGAEPSKRKLITDQDIMILLGLQAE